MNGRGGRERLVAPGHRPDGTLIVIHGFLGSGRNWRSFGGRLIEWRPDWAVELLDLRLHGECRDVPGPHGLASAAEDLSDAGAGAVAVLGNSLGGKVALIAAARVLRPSPVQAWIIDSSPFPTAGGGAAARMLELLAASPERFPSRSSAIDFVEAAGFDRATAGWMATNLREVEDGYGWELDVEGLRALYEDFLRVDLTDDLARLDADQDVHFVRAKRGSAIGPVDLERLAALSSRGAPLRVHELEGGHWLHIDNADGLLELVAGELPRL